MPAYVVMVDASEHDANAVGMLTVPADDEQQAIALGHDQLREMFPAVPPHALVPTVVGQEVDGS